MENINSLQIIITKLNDLYFIMDKYLSKGMINENKAAKLTYALQAFESRITQEIHHFWEERMRILGEDVLILADINRSNKDWREKAMKIIGNYSSPNRRFFQTSTKVFTPKFSSIKVLKNNEIKIIRQPFTPSQAKKFRDNI